MYMYTIVRIVAFVHAIIESFKNLGIDNVIVNVNSTSNS